MEARGEEETKAEPEHLGEGFGFDPKSHGNMEGLSQGGRESDLGCGVAPAALSRMESGRQKVSVLPEDRAGQFHSYREWGSALTPGSLGHGGIWIWKGRAFSREKAPGNLSQEQATWDLSVSVSVCACVCRSPKMMDSAMPFTS